MDAGVIWSNEGGVFWGAIAHCVQLVTIPWDLVRRGGMGGSVYVSAGSGVKHSVTTIIEYK